MVESGGLLILCMDELPYRGFESRPLRHKRRRPTAGVFLLAGRAWTENPQGSTRDAEGRRRERLTRSVSPEQSEGEAFGRMPMQSRPLRKQGI